MVARTIQKAFNAGYLIEKHLPKLSKLLVKGLQDKTSPFATGFIAGSKEMATERTQNKLKFLDKLKQEYGNAPSKSKSKKRDERGMDIDI